MPSLLEIGGRFGKESIGIKGQRERGAVPPSEEKGSIWL